MTCVICTLFEGHYHYGLAVFVNSLVKRGYRGPIYAGFRGPLPPWAGKDAKAQPNGHIVLEVTPDVRIVFIPLKTEAHFANFKPEFMLQLEALAGAESDALVYADPDLMLNIPWSYILDWISCGVTVCEDVNSPNEENHPARVGWRRFFKPHGHELHFRTSMYANSGWVGLTWNHRRLLVVWQEFMTHIAKLLGNSNVVGGIGGGVHIKGFYGFANCFYKVDQDALNAAIEATPEIPVSFIGQEAMGFRSGQNILPHALGSTKPWQRSYLLSALSGVPPSKTEKLFWKLADTPLRAFTPAQLANTRAQLAVGAALGRFIRRTG
ncbi:MAG: hypothetical protein WDO13_16835 [Verrucomicrobiota bacterium]